MKNVFDATNEVNNNIERHKFDWSHNNSFSARLGKLYPMFTSIMPANSSFKCKPELGMQFMPMMFPVQTPMKARLSFFKVPLRTLWNDYRDYIGNFRKDIEVPYHDISDANFEKFFGECQLADYLDIPNVAIEGNLTPTLSRMSDQFTNAGFYDPESGEFRPVVGGYKIQDDYSRIRLHSNFFFQGVFGFRRRGDVNFVNGRGYSLDLSSLPNSFTINNRITNYVGTFRRNYKFQVILCDGDSNILQIIDQSTDNSGVLLNGKAWLDSDNLEFGYTNITWNNDFKFVCETDENVEQVFVLVSYYVSNLQIPSGYTLSSCVECQTSQRLSIGGSIPSNLDVIPPDESDTPYEIITPGIDGTSPYYSSESNPNGLKLNVYRARAYEAIYNAYYRDNRNNPLYVDGQVQYNKWLPNYSGGADTYPYQLHNANWEKDFLSTSVHSPQQGISPLVGLTQYTTNTTDTSYSLSLVTEENKRYQVEYDVANNTVRIGDELPEGSNVEPLNVTKLLNASSIGISIPDLRVVNAYQKFLELNIRKGYSYKEIIEGRFDCKVRFDELMMPEFIGGFTRDISMNRVVQSVDTNSDDPNVPFEYGRALGSLAGDAFLSTNGETPTISCFCDEECIIMGILSVVPVPVYSQLLPKDFLYHDLLDHFNPEFNNLGFQPIRYSEVCPIQCKAYGGKFDDVFGYQRPWYEYVSKVDTSHGLMRTQLRNFIMNRQFSSLPRLNQSFLLVDDNQLNNVFAVTDTTDKIVGQCYFRIEVELPINRIAIPRLD